MTSTNSKKKYLPLLLLLIVGAGFGYFFLDENPTTNTRERDEVIDSMAINLEKEKLANQADSVETAEQLAITAQEAEKKRKVAEEERKKKEQEKMDKLKEQEIKKVPVKEVEEIIIADIDPIPVGGYPAFYKYVKNNLHYPESAKEKEIQGTVNVKFQVLKDGSIGNAKILKGIGGGCDQEALRVIRTGVKWKPAEQNGKKIDYYTVIPITFKLTHIKEK